MESDLRKKVCLGVADLAEGEIRGYEPEGRLVCLAKVDGQYKAIDDWCNHAGCQLSMGWLDPAPGGGKMIVCPCHEIGFHLDTGKNETSPEICDDQAAFPVTVEGGLVWVELPEEG